ncbi:MAG: hypothetical protein ACRDSI_09225 [Pseudonocardiaceae bacterium]
MQTAVTWPPFTTVCIQNAESGEVLPELVEPYGLDAAGAVWAGHSAGGHLAL